MEEIKEIIKKAKDHELTRDEIVVKLEQIIKNQKADNDRCIKALEFALEYGNYDGGHHKMWTIDQIVRILTLEKYEKVIKEWEDGDGGPQTYLWDVGIAP